MKGCQSCGCWDSDREGCTMPEYEMWYACPIESQKPENKKALEEWIDEIRSEHDDDRK